MSILVHETTHSVLYQPQLFKILYALENEVKITFSNKIRLYKIPELLTEECYAYGSQVDSLYHIGRVESAYAIIDALYRYFPEVYNLLLELFSINECWPIFYGVINPFRISSDEAFLRAIKHLKSKNKQIEQILANISSPLPESLKEAITTYIDLYSSLREALFDDLGTWSAIRRIKNTINELLKYRDKIPRYRFERLELLKSCLEGLVEPSKYSNSIRPYYTLHVGYVVYSEYSGWALMMSPLTSDWRAIIVNKWSSIGKRVARFIASGFIDYIMYMTVNNLWLKDPFLYDVIRSTGEVWKCPFAGNPQMRKIMNYGDCRYCSGNILRYLYKGKGEFQECEFIKPWIDEIERKITGKRA